MTSGRELLLAWIKRSKLTQRVFAAEISLTDAHLSQILTGKRRPGLPIAIRIEDRTGVPVRSWLPQRVGGLKTRRGNKAKKGPVYGVLTHAPNS
jgi:transcriptional regulator with XRE-family HTH domain